MTVRCCWIVLVVWSWIGGAAATEPPSGEARYWLQRMADANKTLDYQCVIVYSQGIHLEALQLKHRVEAEGTQQQQIMSLSGPKREVVITHSQATCTVVEKTPQSNCPPNRYKRSSALLTGPRDLTRLEQHYTFTLQGTDRVADRPSVLIAIQPRDKLRFGYRLWLDQQTGILLRSMLLDEEDNVVEQMMFTDLTITRRVTPTASVTEAPPAVLLQSAWKFDYLPAGFEPVRHNHFSSPHLSETDAAKRMTEHLLFSDGLASLSIFLEQLAGAKPFLEGPSRMGAMNAFGAVVADYQVVVVGEVPQDTVQRIARSIHYADPQHPDED